VATGRLILTRTPVIGAVLVGGASRRFGHDKAAVIGPRVLAAMRAADIDPIVAIGGTVGVLTVPTVADRYPGEGPLGAVATALTYARSGWVLIATCDLPLLDRNTIRSIVEKLLETPPPTAVVASAGGVLHPSLACWPASWAQRAHRAVGAGERRYRHLLDLGPIEAVEVDPRTLQDADDPTTLQALLADDRSATR
jgi:molybdopterin-guanine dinucleotide biosynthesis protein A